MLRPMLVRERNTAACPARITGIEDIADYVAEAGPGVAFRRLLPASRAPMRPPLFLLGDVAAVDTAPLFLPLRDPDIGCYSVPHGIVAPTGVAIAGPVAFCASAFNHPAHHVTAIADRLNHDRTPVRRVPGALAVIVGPAEETWGHWLTDFLPRLAVLYDCGWDLGALRFAVPSDLPAFAGELLRLCGIGQDRLIPMRNWREVLQPELLLLPTGLRCGNRLNHYFADATRFWLRRVESRIRLPQSPGVRRLYLSRAGAPAGRSLRNRAEIEHEAKRRGLTVVRPETLGIPEQIALFQNARALVGEYGSALHNSALAGPGAVVCGLRGTSRHPDFYQSGIATALDQQVGYVFGDTTGQDVEQSFTIAPEAFHQAIDIIDCA